MFMIYLALGGGGLMFMIDLPHPRSAEIRAKAILMIYLLLGG